MAAIESPMVPAPVAVAELRSWFNNDWLEWEPETLWSALHDRHLTIPPGAKAAVQAARTVLLGTRMYDDVLAFSAVISGLNNHTPEFRQLVVLSPEELNFGMAMALKLRPGVPDPADEVIRYIRACYAEAGVMAYPESLRFAEPEARAAERQAIRDAAAKGNFDRDTMVGVQAAKLHDLQLYAQARVAEFRTPSK